MEETLSKLMADSFDIKLTSEKLFISTTTSIETFALRSVNGVSVILKTSLFIILFFNAELSIAQSKKEQIEILNFRIDSLTELLATERINNTQKTIELNNSKNSLDEKEKESNRCKLEYNLKLEELKLLQMQFEVTSDSLKYMVASKIEKSIFEATSEEQSSKTETSSPPIVSKYKSFEEFGFDKYTNVSILRSGSKGLLDVNSNSFTKQYKTRVTELYKNSIVNFAGKYTILYWDAGMGTTQGTLIDYSNGKAYDIPINDETAFIGCFDENKLEVFEQYFGGKKVFFTKESNLLVLRSCDEYEENGIIFRFYVWNESSKKFNFLKIEKNIF